MAALNTFVANYIPKGLRHTRDFTGDRGWVHIGNQVIKRLEAEGFLPRDRVFEIPVWIDNDYWPNQIRVPGDFKRALGIYEYDDTARHYEWEWLNGQLRLREDYEDTALVDSTVRQVTSDTLTTYTTISDTGATADDWLGKATLNIGLSPGVNNFDVECRLIYKSTVGSPNYSTIYWKKALPTAVANGDYIYLLKDFLMLRYEAVYALLTAENSEIPLDIDLETVMASGMIALASVPGSKERKQAERDFEQDIDNAGKAHFTPSVEQARPKGRDWPDFSTDVKNTHTWSG